MSLPPPLERIPPQVASLADYEPLARERMSEPAWAYLNGGSGDEWTLRENVAAFSRIPLRSRVLRDMADASTKISLLDAELAAPILLAPIAFQKLAHPDGELASVIAAGALDTAMVVSTQASISLEEIAAHARSLLGFSSISRPTATSRRH
ncbi:alpha-hydroxy-acid oxidizing protein [Novosphingobium pentaromativorans]|uniref:FMN-dependent alpha-hydroxy acid dehydrogenase n=1 Tax=Novosphingobium pentaromativorans US6-1 TaxID=1088721 RepID=G6EK56_9SPHN|nr:alpha-hydroxy-acid oxidizing protein [Novosphingobium pentaromativorans]EHJ58333.1 FMN-dependent alpha-hydroxy acid dehydrogenase [Novosphingobium pentaromativorans US6-1]